MKLVKIRQNVKICLIMAVVSPREIYQDPEIRQDYNYSWANSSELDSLLEALDPIVQQPDFVQVMDDLSDTDLDTWFRYKRVFVNLPPAIIFNNYGEEVLAWAAANATTTDRSDLLKDALEKFAGYDKVLFEKARLWCWQSNVSSKGKDVLSQYALLDTLLRGNALEYLNLTNELRDAALEGVGISDHRAADYQVKPVTTDDDNPTGYIADARKELAPNIHYQIWLDAPVGVVLGYKGLPQAIVGLGINKGKELMIYQLQGLKGILGDPNLRDNEDGHELKRISSRGLMPLDWRKLMINLTTHLAENMGIGSVGIQAGNRNYWAKRILLGEKTPHFPADAARKAYDLPAQRLGFTKGSDDNWHRSTDIT